MRYDIELTGKCNLRCVMCPQYFGAENKELSRNEIDRVFAILRPGDVISLHGVGEPLLSKNLEYTIESVPEGVKIFFNTNGNLLKKSKSELILKYPDKITHLSVSLDAANSSTYRKIRGGDFDLVIRNLREFKNMRDVLGLKQPVIHLNMTVMKENYSELPELVKLSQEFDGVVQVWPLNDDGMYGGKDWVASRGDWYFNYEDQKIKSFQNEFEDVFNSAAEIAAELGVELMPWGDWYQEYDIETCVYPEQVYTLYANGDLKQCCFQTRPISNWKKADFSISALDGFTRKVRSVMLKKKVPLECSEARCPWVNGKKSEYDTNNSNFIIRDLE